MNMNMRSKLPGLPYHSLTRRCAHHPSLCLSLTPACVSTCATTHLDGRAQAESKEEEALALMANLRQAGRVRAFGAARQVPKRIYTLDELRLNKLETEKLLSPRDNSLNAVRTLTQGAALAGLVAASFALHWDVSQALGSLLGGLFLLAADQVANGGGGEALVIDTLGRRLRPGYARRVDLHEAGHFLVAYLVGILPRDYTLSSLDAYRRYRALNVQAGTQFCDASFQAEVRSGRLSSSSLERYACVALAGVVSEYIRFGQAEGGLGDVRQLDALFSALQFTQKKADGEVRWAVLNVASLLRRHAALQDDLAAAMARGESVGRCVELIEGRLATAAAEDI